MESTAASSLSLHVCVHCGLPITSAAPSHGEATDLFCCHACRLAALIVGKQEQGERSVSLLRLAIGGMLAMNVMMVSLLLYAQSVELRLVPLFRLLLLALSAPALALLIPPFLSGALHELKGRRASLDTLIAGGSLSAFALSAVNAVAGSGDIYFDTATMLPVLVTFGKLIEASAKTRAAELLHSLESLLPATALRVTAAGVEEVSLGALGPGDCVRIRPGERVPVDGTIVEGSGSIEEAAFTGEFLPRLCHPGDQVIAGTVNGTGTLLVVAERTGEELLLHGIVTMIREAWQNPCRAERIAQRAATLFIPAVLALAAASFIFWWVGGNPAQGLLSALSVLVVACPCTMGIATPLATSLAIARAARAGIVVRGGSVMERIAVTEKVFFDKTGTLTLGIPRLQEIVMLDPAVEENELLALVAALESASEHPLGKAVLAAAASRGIEHGQAAGVAVFPGSGVRGVVTRGGIALEVSAGSETFTGGWVKPATVDGDDGWSRRCHSRSCSVINVSWDGTLRGRLLLTDTVRPDAAPCVGALRTLGVGCALLSGDRFSAAGAVASETGIGEVYAQRTPAEKREVVSGAVAAGCSVAMVGDGINDAPALAEAQTGIALGAGMELAKQAGNVVILSGTLLQVPWLIALSKRTAGIIRANFAWSFAYNGFALAAAAAGLLHPLLAAVAMAISSLTVLGNSLRISAFPASQDRESGRPPG